jgi:hypothetical protein
MACSLSSCVTDWDKVALKKCAVKIKSVKKNLDAAEIICYISAMPKKKPIKPTTWHITPPADVESAVRKMAEAQTRTVRNMVVVLLREAILSQRPE